MKKIIPIILVSLLTIFGSCSEYKTGEGNLQYKIVKDAGTPKIGKLAVVFLTYSERTESGKLLSGTGVYDPRQSEIYVGSPRFKGDLPDAFQYLSEGDSAIVKISLDSLKKAGYPALPAKDSSKYIVYELKINKVINHQGKADSNFLARVENYKRGELLKIKADEKSRIQRFLLAHQLKYASSPSGLLYPKELQLANNTGGELAVRFQLASLDGQVFQSGFRRLTLPPVNVPKVQAGFEPAQRPGVAHLPGFVEAMRIIPKGRKTKMIIPSALIFGATGNNTDVPPYTPLVCEMEVLNN